MELSDLEGCGSCQPFKGLLLQYQPVNYHANNISSYKSILSYCFINVSLSTSKINYIESQRVYVPHVVNLS